MDPKDKIYKTQEELLDEIEEERKFIEENTEMLEENFDDDSESEPQKKHRRWRIRARTILLSRRIKKFLKPPKNLE